MSSVEEASSALFSSIDPAGPLEVAFLVRRTGAVLASWTRADVQHEVVSVMAATMLGSIETMSEALGCPSPEFVAIETDVCRMLATKVEPHALLVLVADRKVGQRVLQASARRIVAEVSKAMPANGVRDQQQVPAAH